ncbi:hypothetical protein QR680_008878 [Steinernema hermaphroditum]|uniref:Uncharacterized protein n=1 Tax=Steinernema hermaphroditum TaxID=289476 RepID=A0AA39IJM6_9BILA|nr:hypothetical protein QR680_008878 [Steinernema hermaphroditum]
MDISVFEITAKAYSEAALNVASSLVALVAFVPYFKQRKTSSFIGTLLIYLTSCALYSILHAFDSIVKIIGENNPKFRYTFVDVSRFGQWYYTVVQLSTNFIYITGLTLALDRFFVMACPVSYSHMRLSKKICFLAGFLCTINALVMLISFLVLPYGPKTIASTDMIRNYIILIFDIGLLVECALHVVFCFQYQRFAKRQRGKSVKQHVIRANHITLFLIFSQTLFCMFPKISYRGNQILSDRPVPWILRMAMYYTFLLSLHVFLTCCFTVFALRRKQKLQRTAVSVVSLSGKGQTTR